MGGQWIGICTDEQLENVAVLDLTTPEGASVARLRGNGVEAGLPDFAGGGGGVFDVSAGEEGELGDLGCWRCHCGWMLSDRKKLDGSMS